MYYEDPYHPTEKNDINEFTNKELEDLKSLDKGYCKIYRMVENRNGKLKRTPIEFYTSGHNGSNIRDAITGQYMPEIVGTAGEDAYYKVGLSTGECKSKNMSNTLFFTSPQEYATHFHIDLNEIVYKMWDEKRGILTH
jgi:hypothetical protein